MTGPQPTTPNTATNSADSRHQQTLRARFHVKHVHRATFSYWRDETWLSRRTLAPPSIGFEHHPTVRIVRQLERYRVPHPTRSARRPTRPEAGHVARHRRRTIPLAAHAPRHGCRGQPTLALTPDDEARSGSSTVRPAFDVVGGVRVQPRMGPPSSGTGELKRNTGWRPTRLSSGTEPQYPVAPNAPSTRREIRAPRRAAR